MANEFIIKNGFHSKGDSQVTGSLYLGDTVAGSGLFIATHNGYEVKYQGTSETNILSDTAIHSLVANSTGHYFGVGGTSNPEFLIGQKSSMLSSTNILFDVYDSTFIVGRGTAGTGISQITGSLGVSGDITASKFLGDNFVKSGGTSTEFLKADGSVDSSTYLTSVGTINLTSGVTGTLPVANGGTGATTFTAGRVLIGNGTSAFTTDSGFTYSSNKLGIDGTLTSNGVDIISNAATSGNLIIGDTAGDDSIAQMDLKVYGDSKITITDDNVTVKAPKLTGLSAQSSEATSLMVNSTGVVGTRELGSNAFNSTTIGTTTNALTVSTGLNLNSGTTFNGSGAKTISVDVSDFMTNGSSNRIVTATGTDAMNAEANLTFNGSSLGVGAATAPSYELDVFGSIAVQGVAFAAWNSDIIKLGDFDGGGSKLALYDDNSAELVRLDDGKVGIGTTNPSEKLEVVGTIGASGNITGNSFVKSGGTSTEFLKADGSVDSSTYLTSAFPFTGSANISGSSEIIGSGSGIFSVEGSVGSLFSVNDGLDDVIFAANNVSGTPVISANADNTVKLGKLGGFGIVISGSTPAPNDSQAKIIITGSIHTSGSLGVGMAASSTIGRIDAKNDVVAFSTSDERLKDNITPIEDALDKVLQVQGIEFDWIEKEGVHGNEGHDVGVIAQEIEKVLPEVVTTRDNGYKAVKYEKIIPLLVEAIKELQAEVQELKKYK